MPELFNENKSNKNLWYVYIIQCSDKSLYTGITIDVVNRWFAHDQMRKKSNTTKTGAKYFYARAPEQLMYVEQFSDRSEASRREYQIKKMPKSKKMALCGIFNDQCESFMTLIRDTEQNRLNTKPVR